MLIATRDSSDAKGNCSRKSNSASELSCSMASPRLVR